jgi:catechol 2,3-dioxygenase-like lactoylglutathione lyase family enzyme
MTPITPTSLDHVALWADDRDALAALLTDHLGMHEIERTDRFTLVGADARLGKLTLFSAPGPRDPGALTAIVLRVRSLEATLERLPADLTVEHDEGIAWLDAPEGLRLGLVERPGTAADPDLDHVRLRVSDVEATAAAFAELGFARDGAILRVADKWIVLEGGGAPEGERPLLNHLALLVGSAGAVERAARERGADIADVVDAPNTLAVFVWAPDRLKLEYVEHKPSFSLA